MHTNLISGLIHATIAAPGGGKNFHRIILGSQKILLLPVPQGGGSSQGVPKMSRKNAYFSFCAEANISLGTGLTELLSYWATELLSYWATELLSYWATELLSYWATELQLQSYRATELEL